MDYSVVVASIIVFLAVTFLLVGMLLGAKAKLLPSGPVSLMINGENDLSKFAKQNIFGNNIVIGVGAGTISSWMRNLQHKLL